MEAFDSSASLGKLENKVVVLTGGANGIGAALVHFCAIRGAYICLGDVSSAAGELVAQEAAKAGPPTADGKPRATFVKTDVTEYAQLYQLFDHALKTYGRVDAAVSCAGVIEKGNFWGAAGGGVLNLSNVMEPPTHKALDINLMGSLYFARIATVFLQQNKQPGDDKSLTLMSSTSGFAEHPGCALYNSSKHAIIGITRAMRNVLLHQHGIRLNAIAPSWVRTDMMSGFVDLLDAANLPVCEPAGIARVIAEVACDEGCNGKVLFVQGDRAVDIEPGLAETRPQWLGKEANGEMEAGGLVIMKAVMGGNMGGWL